MIKTALFQVVVDGDQVLVASPPPYLADADRAWNELADAVEQLVDRKIGRQNIPLAIAASVALALQAAKRGADASFPRPMGVPVLEEVAPFPTDVVVPVPFSIVSLAADHIAGTAANEAQRDLAAELRTRAMDAIMNASIGTPR